MTPKPDLDSRRLDTVLELLKRMVDNKDNPVYILTSILDEAESIVKLAEKAGYFERMKK